MPAGALDAQVRLVRGAFVLDARIATTPGETVALLGVNGAGKSTLLAALAGLAPIDSGRVAVDGEMLDAGPGERFVPPARRPIGVVLQSPALFPHLSARDNVAFGLRAGGMRRGPARERADAALRTAGLGALADRRPAAISGGQAARVALVRALIRRPAVLLLDEPLAAIDAAAKPDLRAALAAELASFAGTTVLVTHDAHDAIALTHRGIVLDRGVVVAEGALDQLRAHPAAAPLLAT